MRASRPSITGLSRAGSVCSAEASSPYKIEVTPGNAKVPRGADQAIRAKLLGFSSKDVSVMMRTATDGPFERVPLIASEKVEGAFEGVLFHLEKKTEYYVASNGVYSPRFSLDVVNLPTVQNLDLEYRFPSYTGLAPRTIEDGGDVATLLGTDVRLHIQSTMAVKSGRIVMHDGTSSPLTSNSDGTLAGNFTATGSGSYRIELDGPAGEKVEASPSVSYAGVGVTV